MTRTSGIKAETLLKAFTLSKGLLFNLRDVRKQKW